MVLERLWSFLGNYFPWWWALQSPCFMMNLYNGNKYWLGDKKYYCCVELGRFFSRSVNITSCFAGVGFLGWDAVLVMVAYISLQLYLVTSVVSPPHCHQKFKKVNACLVVGVLGTLYSQLKFSLPQRIVCTQKEWHCSSIVYSSSILSLCALFIGCANHISEEGIIVNSVG